MRRVVITGVGAVTPIGIGADASWHALCRGESGVTRITRWDASRHRSQVAAEVQGFNPEDFVGKKQIRTMDLFILYAMAAARMAMEDSGFDVASVHANRAGLVVGSALQGMQTVEYNQQLFLDGMPDKISPFFVPGFIANMAACQIAIAFGIKGPLYCPVTACATGTHAIGDAFKALQRGDVDFMLAGGAEAAITPLICAGFDALKVTSPRNDEPKRASRPFDKDRDGFAPGEGSGIVTLEGLESALDRGAKIYAEIVGYGITNDAYHIVSTDPQGDGAARCMQMALADAGISPDQVDYINAHGTSTIVNDLSETMAIHTVFGEYGPKVPVSSNKSMIGHLMGGSGAVEAIFTALTLKYGIIPPTVNYDTPDPQCDLNIVGNVAQRVDVKTAISNSFGFGGTNGVLVLNKFQE
ncbi:MAG: beta-ketoacyl-ACP synthase II [Chloroflexota bacterium]